MHLQFFFGSEIGEVAENCTGAIATLIALHVHRQARFLSI
jgi:hypothetical protein